MANNISSSGQFEASDANQVPDSPPLSSHSDVFQADSDDSSNSYSMYSSNDLPVLSRQSSTSSTVTTHFNGTYDAEICADLRGAEKCLDLPLHKKYRSVSKRDSDALASPSAYFNTNILPEKRLSDPQIRYSFYNKGFEMATHFRKYSLTHCELRKNAMPNITEQESFDAEDDSCNDDSISENHCPANVILNSFYSQNSVCGSLSSSGGRDITKLPKLKIRISDEMGHRVKSSFDDSDDNSDSDNWFVDPPIPSICSHTNVDPFQLANNQAKNPRKCHKCGHKLIKKQFTNSFI